MANRIRGGSWLVFWVVLLAGTSAYAAEITDVVDAADEDFLEGKVVPDYFDFHIQPMFKQVVEQAKITREAPCTGGSDRCANEDTTIINKELRYQRVINQLDLDFELSIYKDLALHVNLPIVFSDQRKLKYARNSGSACEFGTNPDNPKCVNSSNSTVDPSDPRIQADIDDGGEFTTYRYFDVPDVVTTSDEAKWAEGPERSGLGDITIGIDWAPFNDQRYIFTEDPWVRNHGRSTLLFGFDYTIPTADAAGYELRDNAWKSNNAVGKGVHELKLRVATSRRYKFVDPYMQFQFGLPITNDTAYKDYGGGQERVGPGPWGDLTVGIEFIPWERLTVDFQQRFAVDLRATFGYVGEGREMGPFFDAIGQSQCQGVTWNEAQAGGQRPECGWLADKWANAGFNNLGIMDVYGAVNHDVPLYDDGITSYEGYGRFGAQLGFYIQPIQYVQLKANLGLTHDQEHFMTFAKAGNDVRGRLEDPNDPSQRIPSDNAPKDGTVSFDDIRERNPVYNPSYDAVGSRFRIEEATNFTWNIGLAFQF